jgi:hypothetical protein
MPRNPESPVQGAITDPDFRRRRAVHAAKSRTGVDFHIAQLEAVVSDLTAERRARLAALLSSAEGNASRH